MASGVILSIRIYEMRPSPLHNFGMTYWSVGQAKGFRIQVTKPHSKMFSIYIPVVMLCYSQENKRKTQRKHLCATVKNQVQHHIIFPESIENDLIDHLLFNQMYNVLTCWIVIYARKTIIGSCVFCAPLDRYIDQHLGQHINQHSTNVSVDIAAACRSTYQSNVGRYTVCRPRCVGQRIADASTEISAEWSADILVDIVADTWPIPWPLIVGGISFDRRWYIGHKLRLLVYKLYAFHSFLVNLQNFWRLHVWPSCAANSVIIKQIHKIQLTG